MREIGLRKPQSEQQDGETDWQTDLTELLYKGEDLRCKHFARGCKLSAAEPALALPRPCPVSYAKNHHSFLMPTPGVFLTQLNLISALHCSVLENCSYGWAQGYVKGAYPG